MSDNATDPGLSPVEKLVLLNEIGRLVLAAGDVNQLFEQVAGLLRTRLKLQYVMVGTFDLERQVTVTRATAGFEPDPSRAMQPRSMSDGIIGKVRETGHTVVVNDVSQDPRYVEVVSGTRSEICVPLRVDAATVGFLNIESERLGAFEKADVELLEAVGSFLGQAIRNAELRAKLEDSRSYLDSVIQNAGDAILTVDLDGRIRTWNRAAETMLGPPPEKVLWDQVVERMDASGEKLRGLYELVLSGETIRDVQLDIGGQDDGPGRTLELSMAPIYDRQNRIRGVSCIVRDVTESIRAEAELKRNLEAMQLLSDVSIELTSILDLDALLNRIAVLMRRVIEYEILGIFLFEPERETLHLRVAIGYADETVRRIRELPAGTGLIGHAIRERKLLRSDNLAEDPRAISVATADGRSTQSEVAAPIVFRDRVLGGLVVESCDPKYFTSQHVQILGTLASQMAVAIDNAQLFQKLSAKEQKLETDFAMARDLQASMLPRTMPAFPNLDVAAEYRAAESLGGDYYDFIRLEGDLLGLAIGDVSGKGVRAAMTMAATRSALRFAARMNSSPSQVLYHVNRRLYRDVKERTFVSLFYGTLDLRSRVLRWSNGGHFPPLLLRSGGSLEELSKGGTLVALFDKSRYSSGRTLLRPGDLLCFYTDGLIEASNRDGEEFGRSRLEEILRRESSRPAKEVLRCLLAAVSRHARDMKLQDDVTAFVIKIREDA